MKRADYISWDEYFMGIAMLAARRSKDPNTQVGACIVSQDNIIISTGYNGMPKGCSDDEFPPNAQVLYSDNFAEGFAAEDRGGAGDILISVIKRFM